MIFHSAKSLRLVAIVWTSFLVCVGALPHVKPEPTNPASTIEAGKYMNGGAECRAVVLASVPTLRSKIAQEHPVEYAEEWCSQLEQGWIKHDPQCIGFGKNKQVFLMDDLTNTIAHREVINKTGKEDKDHLGFFILPDQKGVDLHNRIVKLVDISPGHSAQESASCERQSLQDFRDYVRTGFTTLHQKLVGVIIREGVRGHFMTTTNWWQRGSKEKKGELLNSLRGEVQNMILEFLNEGLPLNANVSEEDMLMDENGSLYLINFGAPGILHLRFQPSKDQFQKWFERRWYFLWKEIYDELGTPIPPQYHWKPGAKRR